ncbi:glutamate-tRNA ligase [Fomitiporia mediterranea MF3/22]|uniref:glutamate-tRNA ligase n=1 Tax=Fomitiporia mediterranea (strain MF3/22) TaxID=694068 RepID=UPI0004409721|nr:glutamate-tRNA ligase [Fomitiporia mediterranea MF3/22]EJC98400.1 glutamate-tRNA ligase [Fomitiporia mediterranea MF3/22]
MYKLSVSPTSDPFPFAALAISSYLKDTVNVTIDYDRDGSGCCLTRISDGTQIEDGESIVRTLAKEAHAESNSTQGEALFALAKSLPTTKDFTALVSALDSLDDRLALRTFLDGHEITVADWLVWGAIKGSLKPLGIMKGGKHPHLLRWFTYIESLPTTQIALNELAEAKSRGVHKGKAASSFALGLEHAEMGKVVTRFPPEPSGYLHIGHLKAAILNQYFAEMYKGKLIVRFDDTNPEKEKEEYEDAILEDLAVLNIRGDKISHTSDYFDQLYDYALQMIKDGNAYVDDTDRETMQKERMDGIASKRRDLSVEENLKRFDWMKEGTEEGLKSCLRAKISFTDPNKAMRDPVIYRCNPLPHHRTGDKWKIYPTYDFACPVIDAYEGVTHALRTNEYRDRNPQYQWMLDALTLRKVYIWDFSRINFVFTFLSKRKLRDCLALGLARGWDDPRFPTFRGMRRRGMTTEALRQFMLSQGPSQNQVLLEWDSIWTINKKIIDPIAPRFCAIGTDKMVQATVKGGPADPETKEVPRHRKNASVGLKTTVYSSTILVEQEDAKTFADNEEITLMDWGNAIVRNISRSASGDVTHLDLDLHLAGDFKATEKKITWLAVQAPSLPLVPVTLLDYDYMVTKRKLEKDDTVESVATPQTEFKVEALADANVLTLKERDTIQFERKGYFILDKIVDDANSKGKRLEFIRIPDGRAAGIALKAPTDTKSSSKANETVDSNIKMYKVDPINKVDNIEVSTSMYKMRSVYED